MSKIINGAVYKLKNKVNGKVYIGQTIRSVRQRLNEHRSKAKNDVSNRLAIHHAMAKYGFDSFKCIILEDEIKNFDKLQEREMYYIKKYKSYYEGYNMSFGGDSPRGAGNPIVQLNKDTGEVLEHYPSAAVAHRKTGIEADSISEAARGEGYTAGGYAWELLEEFSKDSFKFCKYKYMFTKPIVQFDKLGRKIKIYDSVQDAGFQNNIDPGSISKVAKGERFTAGGYMWSYYKDYQSEDFTPKEYPSKNLCREKIPVTQVDRHNGQIVAEYDSMYEAAQAVGNQVASISAVINGKIDTTGGYIWLKQGEYKNFKFNKMDYIQAGGRRPVIQLDKDTGGFINKFNSIIEASNYTGVCKSGIGRVARGKGHISGGYVWQYYSEYLKQN